MDSQSTIDLIKDKLVENKCKVTIHVVIFGKGFAEPFVECLGSDRINWPAGGLPLWTKAG